MKQIINGFKGITLFLIAILLTQTVFAQSTKISGKVVDAKGTPISGANVRVKGSNSGTTTNEEGVFNLTVNDAAKSTLLVSFVGYDDKMINLTSGSNNLDVVLKEAGSTLNAIVVTANNSRRTQMEMPISVTSFSASKLANLRFNSNADILRAVPGITAEGANGGVTGTTLAQYGIGLSVTTGQPAIPYSDFRFIWPIPAIEITTNPIIVQNPGY